MRQTFYDILKIIFDSFMQNVHIAIPGRIESYDASKKKAEVKPLIRKQLPNEVIDYPVITDVPVILPGGSNSVISLPIEKGDGCLILFSEVSMENFLSSSGEVVDPGDQRKFSLSDAICIPGLSSFNNLGKVGDGNDLQIISDKDIKLDGANIIADGTSIELNGNSKRFVTYAELNTALQTFITTLNTHVHPGVTSGPSSTGPMTPPATLNISASETQTIKTGG